MLEIVGLGFAIVFLILFAILFARVVTIIVSDLRYSSQEKKCHEKLIKSMTWWHDYNPSINKLMDYYSRKVGLPVTQLIEICWIWTGWRINLESRKIFFPSSPEQLGTSKVNQEKSNYALAHEIGHFCNKDTYMSFLAECVHCRHAKEDGIFYRCPIDEIIAWDAGYDILKDLGIQCDENMFWQLAKDSSFGGKTGKECLAKVNECPGKAFLFF